MSKCAFWWPTALSLEFADAHTHDICQKYTANVRVPRTPVGDDDYMGKDVSFHLGSLAILVEELKNLEDTQASVYLLRLFFCIRKISRLLLMGPPDHLLLTGPPLATNSEALDF